MKKHLLLICGMLAALAGGITTLAIGNNVSPAAAITPAETLSTQTATQDTLPGAYCMRDDYVIYAQDQDRQGLCWNFAATMSASTTIMKATNEYYDFSELWNGISSYQTLRYYDKIGAGGSFSYQTEAMRSGGLMLESDLPYQHSYIVSNENALDYYNFYNKYSDDTLADCLQYDSLTCSISKTNVDKIKNHIYNHGSMYASFIFREGFIDGGGSFYKVPNQKNTHSNHAVSIIGWDDNYEKVCVTDSSSTPTKFKGAWIILNSYTEISGTDGLSFVFYDDTNLGSRMYGYTYAQDTTKDLYFYDKIESGYDYPINVKGKYCGDFVATSAATKQKNIFYDDVNLEYSYTISEGATIKAVNIYLDNIDVSDLFEININADTKRFSISKENADYGNYKVLISYGNNQSSDTYLNNFFVTHGIAGEELAYFFDSSLGFTNGSDLEFYSYNWHNKDFIIYTNKLSGTLAFDSPPQSVYSEQHISIPDITFEITDGKSCTKTYTVTANTGYQLDYNFIFEYYEDTTLETVNVFYDLGGGINSPLNRNKEVANATTDLALQEPTREGFTFAGWYLDYGNGSKKLQEIDNVHYIDWEDIHHMGENPTLFAISHYKSYYNNSNTVFVYAHWEEDEYHNIQLSVGEHGTVTPGKNVLVRPDSVVYYKITPESGYCLSDVKFNGISVDKKELLNIQKNGLVLKNITEDTSVEVTFAQGVLIGISVGQNIKSAYVVATINGQTRKFYSGDVIPSECLNSNAYYNYYDLIVEVFDDTSGYTYYLDNISSYLAVEKGKFSKSIYITKNSKYQEFIVGNATPKEIKSVNITYSVNFLARGHYISKDINATSGESGKITALTGEVVYVFLKSQPDTVAYKYQVPSGFESIGDCWYRKGIYVREDKTNLGTFSVQTVTQSYLITFKNWDGSIIGSDYFDYSSMPDYYDLEDYEPERPDDERYTYTFVGWDPLIKRVVGDATYTAVFTRTPKEYTITVEETENGIVEACSDAPVNCEGTYTYIFTANEGYKIKDVIVNGTSLGAIDNYTFADVCSNQTIKVEFEKIVNDSGNAWLKAFIYTTTILMFASVVSLEFFKKKHF